MLRRTPRKGPVEGPGMVGCLPVEVGNGDLHSSEAVGVKVNREPRGREGAIPEFPNDAVAVLEYVTQDNGVVTARMVRLASFACRAVGLEAKVGLVIGIALLRCDRRRRHCEGTVFLR